jgi:hypothetical protein
MLFIPIELIMSVKSLVKCLLLPDIVYHVNYKENFPESTGTIHFLIALLITILYRQNH